MDEELAKELLEEMNGREIESLHYEAVIGVRGKEVIDRGKVVDVLDSTEKIKRLWDELVFQEWGTNDLATILRREGF